MIIPLQGRVNANKKQFLTSRVSTPVPFKPKHVREFSASELDALEKLNLSVSPTSPKGADSHMTPSKMNIVQSRDSVTAKKVDLDLLEKKAEEQSNGINGHS